MSGLRLIYKAGKIIVMPKATVDKLLQDNPSLETKIKLVKGEYTSDAAQFRGICTDLNKLQFSYTIEGRENWQLKLGQLSFPEPYTYQQEAIEAWLKTKKACIEIPTGGGKTLVGSQIIAQIKGTSLILVPTIELLNQWHKRLKEYLGIDIGRLGDGTKDILPVTVSTYDSALIYADNLSPHFALVILDEVHHAAAPGNMQTLRKLMAPYRLGLSATMPEEEWQLMALNLLVGKVAYTITMDALQGKHLSDFERTIIHVEMSPEERADYDLHRGEYLDFRARKNIPPNMNWKSFIFLAYRSPEGKKAVEHFHQQKKIALNAAAKLVELKRILKLHQNDRVLVFTNDNSSADLISQKLKIPILIYNTKKKERKELLEKFASGEIKTLVSSRVLNEGIDVPEASVAVVYSGTGTTREHIQRLGRILRKQDGKKAILYELVTLESGEEYSSRRRNAFLEKNGKPDGPLLKN